MTRASTAIMLSSLSWSFGDQPLLDNLSLTIEAGSTVALLGPSGCGKSTLLKLLAGLLQPQRGEIWFGDRRVASAHNLVPPEQRNIGMVFQDYALWPHMTVAQNVAFPLRMRRLPVKEQRQRVEHALSRVGLADLATRKPAHLSGGQQQRVALARAIVGEPAILLFDEPLSNLDSFLRQSLCEEMSALLRQLRITAVYVTHDRQEAALMADRIVQLAHGRIDSITHCSEETPCAPVNYVKQVLSPP
ncbi:Ferric iron ABC transporter, substrate-binding protein [Paramixta manurensis]|uniref:Ferric iron ABC transporter, substrate-binding protein n=1 Tax=Paramixta manurensis TaxID=2740817 RepID=A0A6M8U9Q4_9GAMM|nr:Ferric iron ABC transporter, substrate-binding protein [Erwiniaceae bacterium PD-1]